MKSLMSDGVTAVLLGVGKDGVSITVLMGDGSKVDLIIDWSEFLELMTVLYNG